MQDKINFYQVRGIGEIINVTIEFIKVNFKSLMKCIFFIAGPGMLLSSIAYGFMQANMYSYIAENGRMNPLGMWAYSMSLIGWTFLFYFISMFLLVAVVYEYILIYSREERSDITVSEVWQGIKKDTWMIFKTFIGIIITTIIVMLIVMLAFFVMAAIGGALGAVIMTAGGLAGQIIGAILGFLIVIGFFVLIFYAFSPLCLIFNVRIIERRKFLDTISRTYALIKNRRWKTVGIIMIAMIVQFSVSFIFNLPAYAMEAYKMQTTATTDLSTVLVFLNSFLILLSYFLQIVNICAINFHYFSLVEEKESVGMMRKVSVFGAGTVNGNIDEETY